MKIAIISAYLPSGSKIGVGYQVHYYANALSRRGHEVTVFCPFDRPADAEYDVVTVPVGSSLRTFRFAFNLRRYEWRFFDIIHAHTDDYWLMGRPRPFHVRTMHGSCWAEALHSERPKEKLRMALLAASEHLATLVANRTIANAANTLRFFPQIKEFIPCGVDTHAFRPGPEKSLLPSILFVGTLHRRKRGWLVLKAFQEEIRPRFPGAELWMVCNDEVNASGVRMFSSIPMEKLVECYQRAWVFTLPSTYEGFGVPYIEAMACGTPVIATPNLGAKEVLGGGEYGILAEDHELGRTLCRLLADSEERAKWIERGLKRSDDYSWDTVTEAYERIYQSGQADLARRDEKVAR